MEEFLEFVAKQLVEYPDEIVITRVELPRKIILKMRLRQSDVGKIIGKQGHTIDALRNLLNAAGSRHNQRVALEIIEDRAAA